MRKWCFALAVVSAVSVSASVPAQAQKWFDGLYIGLNAGLGDGDHDRLIPSIPFANSYSSRGHLLGGHVGFSLQSTPMSGLSVVAGVEVDAAWTNIEGNDNGVGGTVDESRFNWLASVRGRLGVASGNFLVFGTVGWGFAEIEHTNVSGVPSSIANNVDGLTYGFGAQLALNNVWSVGAEWRRYDFGTYGPLSPAGLNPFTVDNTLDTFSIRATMCLAAC